MKLKNCQRCGTFTDLSKMYVKKLENPEPYLENNQVFEKIIELLCQKCAELENLSLKPNNSKEVK